MNADLKKLYTMGFEYEKRYGNCAQCTLGALLDYYDAEGEDVFKAATGLSGGTGGMGDGNCGAYSGGVLFLSLLQGREKKDFSQKDKAKRAGELARRLHEKFLGEYGGVICRDVQSRVFGRHFNLQDPEEYRAFEAAGAHLDKCPSVVGKAARWVGEIISSNES